MVSTLHLDYRYLTTTDSELDGLLRGEDVGTKGGVDFLARAPLHRGETGVLVALRPHSGEPSRPLALVAHDDDIRRLCGRYAQLRADLSPLTAWCHLLTPDLLHGLDGIVHEPSFRGTEAAWSGLVVAESVLLTRKPLANIRISACMASATYAVGRVKALWRHLAVDAILERFDVAKRLCRGGNGSHRNEARTTRVRSSFVPMWNCLSALTENSTGPGYGDVKPLVMALKALRDAKSCGDADEAGLLIRSLLPVAPEVHPLERLTEMTPESRLRLFDELVSTYRLSDADDFLRHNALGLTVGYLATVAAGGASSLALVDEYAEEWPELTGWAYLVGSIGEKITWTSGFDGLGRLISRELLRKLRLDDSPMCDFALDEAVVLSDAQLREPLVHLRVKQARVLSVALYPGANIAVPIGESAVHDSPHQVKAAAEHPVSRTPPAGSSEVLEVMAMALWPYIRPLIAEEMGEGQTSGSGRGKGRGKKKTVHSGLPLRGAKR